MKFLAAVLMALIFFAPAEAKFKCEAPGPTTEFERMAFSQVYPTYSWEPVAGAEFYQIQVIDSRGKIVRDMLNTESLNRMTDWEPFTEVGEYFWQVRAVDKNRKPLSDWSERKYFSVKAPVTFAALGDSITHGGAAFIPAGQLSCQWETFCEFPIKNIGRSGDTTAMMIERFERDVLPFQPKVLLILGGLNDIRGGATAEEVIASLKILREKCLANGITPYIGTITPMNAEIISGRGIYLTEKYWQFELAKVNRWILENGGVDISSGLEGRAGELRAGLTPDGLHPNLRGKIFIGKAIEKFLEAKGYVRADG
ncbi:MAG: hypothetical protein J5809_04025 [Selenomonadaceae bacterium]|nr:hypothetical protein [Selenomonadaceae bacterium]